MVGIFRIAGLTCLLCLHSSWETQASTAILHPLVADTCPPNINFELGNFFNWETNIGNVSLTPGFKNRITWQQPVWTLGSGLPIRHELIDRTNTTAVDFWGGFPLNPPVVGGRYAVRLGSDRNDPTSPDSFPNALTEAIRYKISVPVNAKDYGIIFSYAVVFENPNHPQNLHTYDQQPRFITRMYEPGGDTLKCANFTFVASDPLPGFSVSPKVKIDSAQGRFPGGVNFAPVKYKPWSSVYVSLDQYAGKTIYLEFITADCTKRGHFGYGYVDVLECIGPVSAILGCDLPPTTTLIAPPGFKSYQWWNNDFTRLLGTGDTLRINAGLKEKDIVNVQVFPFDSYGCEDTLSAAVRINAKAAEGIRYPTIETVAKVNTNLNARNIGKTYLWTPPAGLDNNKVRNPVFNGTSTLEYLINITNDNNCPTVDTQLVAIIEKVDIMVPDIFSPNGDGKNDMLDIFPIGMKEIKFWVFNRWGQLMFETSNPAQRWDGNYRGVPQPLETYVWVAEGITLDGQKIRRRGQTVLIR